MILWARCVLNLAWFFLVLDLSIDLALASACDLAYVLDLTLILVLDLTLVLDLVLVLYLTLSLTTPNKTNGTRDHRLRSSWLMRQPDRPHTRHHGRPQHCCGRWSARALTVHLIPAAARETSASAHRHIVTKYERERSLTDTRLHRQTLLGNRWSVRALMCI